jgi:uncharacterized protein (DUF2267 family)
MKTGPQYRYKLAARIPKRKTSHDVFDTTIQKTQVWLNDVMRDRLTVEEAVQLGAQLPMLVRGFYFEGWTLKGKPHKERHKRDFLDHIEKVFKNDVTVSPQQICRAVFRVLGRHTSKGEIEDVKHLLPKEFQELWP